MPIYKKNSITKIINIFLIISYFLFYFNISVFSKEISIESTLKTYVLAPVSGMNTKSLQMEEWKKFINDEVHGKNGIKSKQTLDLSNEKLVFFHGILNRRSKKDKRKSQKRSDRRQDLYFHPYDSTIKDDENTIMDYIQTQLFNIYEKVINESNDTTSKMKQIERISTEASPFINLWLAEKDNIPPTLYKQIALLEKSLFKQSFTETIMHELKKLTSNKETRRISMFSLGISMSELNSAGGYNFADFIRTSQVRFFQDMFWEKNRVLLTFNKMVVIGLKKSLLKSQEDLNDMSILEYININGFKNLPDIYKNELSKDQIKRIEKKYSKDLKTRIENKINKQSDFSIGQKQTWNKYLEKLAIFSNKSTKQYVHFNSFTREFSGLHAQILHSLDLLNDNVITFNQAKDEIMMTINKEIKTDEKQVEEEINNKLRSIFEINSNIELSALTNKDVDKLPIQTYNSAKYQFDNVKDFNDFKKMLKNLIKRRRYIKNDIFLYLNKYHEKFMNTENLQNAKTLLDNMIHEKAKEIQARIFNEFEGRSKGYTYYYEDMIGLAEIPDEIFWHNKDLNKGLPDQDRYYLIEAVKKDLKNNKKQQKNTKKKIDNFLQEIIQIKEKNIFDDRHHKFISKEFFHIICEQCYNKNQVKKGNGNEFYDKFGYLWGTDYPLMATIGGDELHISFKGTDGEIYSLSYDFNNFQGCDLLLRNINGAPYSKDDLLFNIHESIVTTLIEKINSFRNNKEINQKTFQNIFHNEILPDIGESVVSKVKVELNPFNFFDDKLLPHEQYLNNLLTMINNLNWNNDSEISTDEKEEMGKEIELNLVKIKFFKEFKDKKLKEIPNNNSLMKYLKTNETIKIFLKREFNFEDNKLKSPKLSLSLKYFFFPGLSKTKYSGRMLKGKWNNVQLAAITMKSLTSEIFQIVPFDIFYAIQDWLDKRLGEIKKNNLFNSSIFAQDTLNENKDSEYLLYSKNNISNISNEYLIKQQKVLDERKNYFDIKVLDLFENPNILIELYKNTTNSKFFKYANAIKSFLQDFRNFQPFSSKISELLYRTIPNDSTWELDVRGSRVSIYDKEHFTENATKNHLEELLKNYKINIDQKEAIANIIIKYGKKLQKEFNKSQRMPRNQETEDDEEFQTAA